MDKWTHFLDQIVKLIYEDGVMGDHDAHFSKKIGKVLEITNTHLVMDNNGRTIAILLNKIIRIEVLGDNGDSSTITP